MGNFIPICEAKDILDTNSKIIYVTACQHKKKCGEYPIWYKTDGRKSSVDIDYLSNLRDSERVLQNKSVELYYFIIDDMDMKESRLSRILASESEIYMKASSWLMFMRSNLFSEPRVRYHERVTRIQEFHRIATKMKGDFLCDTQMKNYSL